MYDLIKFIIHNTPPPDTDSSGGLFYRKTRLEPPNAQLLSESKFLEIGRAQQRIGGIFCSDNNDGTRVKRLGNRFR